MIMLIENVLPSGYFDQTLRALSVDMAVLRDLVHQRLPRLSAHLDHLQMSSGMYSWRPSLLPSGSSCLLLCRERIRAAIDERIQYAMVPHLIRDVSAETSCLSNLGFIDAGRFGDSLASCIGHLGKDWQVTKILGSRTRVSPGMSLVPDCPSSHA